MAPLRIVDQKLKNWGKSQNVKGTDILKELHLTPATGAWIIGNSVPKKLFCRHVLYACQFFQSGYKEGWSNNTQTDVRRKTYKKCFCVFIQVEKIIVHPERPEISFFLSIVNLRSDNGLDKLRHPSR